MDEYIRRSFSMRNLKAFSAPSLGGCVWIWVWLLAATSCTKGNDSLALEEVTCNRTYLDACQQNIQRIVGHSLWKRMPMSRNEVNSSCTGFHTGMDCFERYVNKCHPELRTAYKGSSSGARSFFKFLCSSSSFQNEYLQHTMCFKGIHKDWESCTNRFIQLTGEEMTRRNASQHSRDLELCCAKHGFIRCVYMAGKFKCQKESALFLLKMAEIMADEQDARTCEGINFKVCSSSSMDRASCVFTLLLLLLRGTY